MATTDASAARRALATQMLVNLTVTITLGLVGFALLGYFQQFPERLDDGILLKANADRVFPHFIAFHLPPGISGLVVAAMFAAAMSSIDSGVNSITAVVFTDILGQNRSTESGDQSAVQNAVEPEISSSATPYSPPVQASTDDIQVSHARWLAFGIGAFVVIASSAMGAIPGNITSVTTKTANLLTTPIFGLFFFALFVPFASPRGVAVGAVCGTTTAILIAFSGPIFGFVPGPQPGTELDPISFQWIAPAAITVNIVTGCIASLVLPKSSTANQT